MMTRAEQRQETDRKVAGRLLQRLNNVFAMISAIMADMNMEILEFTDWCLGSGRGRFEACFRELCQYYLNARESTVPTPPVRWRRVITPTWIEVNLDAPPTLPFPGATPEPPRPGDQPQRGWVKLEKRPDGELYVDGRKVILHLSDTQKAGNTIRGYELREQLTGALVLHPNILDALLANPQLFPESWKKDEGGTILYVYFWAKVFRSGGGSLIVRCCYFSEGQWLERCFWLDRVWGGHDPAAQLAS